MDLRVALAASGAALFTLIEVSLAGLVDRAQPLGPSERRLGVRAPTPLMRCTRPVGESSPSLARRSSWPLEGIRLTSARKPMMPNGERGTHGLVRERRTLAGAARRMVRRFLFYDHPLAAWIA